MSIGGGRGRKSVRVWKRNVDQQTGGRKKLRPRKFVEQQRSWQGTSKSDISGPNMRMRTRPPSPSFGNDVGFAWVLAQGRHEKPHKHMAGKKVWFCIKK